MTVNMTLGSPGIPNLAGVYLFKKGSRPIYIGKAVNLKKRLASYFRKNAGEKVRLMLQEATKLDWIETESEIDALLKEAEFIKKYRPKYNVLMRDDKNYFYVGVTLEEFPRIFITHQPQKVQSPKLKIKSYIGPFTSGAALKTVLKLLRKIFPYCTCKKPHRRFCLNAAMGRCLGCCCLKNVTTIKRPLDSCNIRYQENIKNLVAVLSGRKKNLLKVLRKQMREAVNTQEFEKAAKFKDQAIGLENIFGHRQALEVRPSRGSLTSQDWNKIAFSIQTLLEIKRKISRVEGYDISNISGTEATGSMVVFIDGKPAKSEYRKFKIKTVSGSNDVSMLKEVIRRRLAHPEWSYPDLMLMDGGKPQLNAALATLKLEIRNLKSEIPKVMALAKREEELYTENRKTPIKLNTLPRDTKYFFQRVRDESHRFAKKYHHKLREILYREPR